MNTRWKANLLLLMAAIIWGFAFVAQRVSVDYMGPFSFNGIRFLLGSLSLVPLLYWRNKPQQADREAAPGPDRYQNALPAGILAGAVLFAGASLQQIGLVYITAGKAAFITGLYIVLIPLAGIFLRQRLSALSWLSCGLAVIGLFLLCVKENLTLAYGDFLEFIGAFFWAAHILLIGHFSRRVDVLKLSAWQFITCGLLSLGTALWLETITMASILAAAIPILYGGICSVGIAYTLQVMGQQYAAPTHAAIILSMETVFAAIGGFWLLDEILGTQELLGCALMFAGMLLSQLQSIEPAKDSALGETTSQL
ncbi:DMT family transporter [Acetonema longum]|uniref:EamA domain-containing protein n=1 Tax=Acetonema longum DSM 6540 TaxID=1009370 RepID=F7NLP1_9FIRM|nr:DMT family transporter [Acetonema longum]EGO62982.1 hypothetical protein ALO_15077 [Acetonema longum DSM 6540]